MQNTSLCYIEKNDSYLMLHRIKKVNDVNKDKWIGIGGHFEENESPEDCVLREAFEETGLTLHLPRYCGVVTFLSDSCEGEYMHLFHATEFSGDLKDCDEGSLEWVPKNKINDLEHWKGDEIFLALMENKVPFFSLKLMYSKSNLACAILNGKNIDLAEFDKKGIKTVFDSLDVTHGEHYNMDLSEKLSAVLGGINGGLKICKNEDGYPYEYISTSLAEMQGYTVDELLSVTYGYASRNIVDADKEKIHCECSKSLKTGDTYSIKYRVRHKNGSYIWVRENGKSVMLPGGRNLIYALVQDVNEEEILNEILVQERGQYRDALVKNASYFYTVDVTTGYIYEDFLDRDGNFILKPLGLEVPCSLEAKDHVFQSVYGSRALDEKTKALFSCDGFARIFESGVTSEEFEHFESVHGTYIKTQVLLSRNINTGHIMATCICYDITREKQISIAHNKALSEKVEVQKRLLEEERNSRRQSDIIQVLCREYTSVYFVNLDEDKAIPFRVSDEIQRSIGIKLGTELVFSSIYDVYVRSTVIEDEIDEMLSFAKRSVLEDVLRETSIFTHQYKIFRDSKELYAQIRIAKLGDDERVNTLVFGFAVVDEQMRNELERQRLLKDALAAAEYANKAKTVFLNNMSHDIRTPMNAIIGFTALAISHIDNTERVMDYLNKIQSSSGHLLSLINEVLDMSRIESGKVEIEESDELLPDIIHNIKNIVQADIRAKHLDAFFDAVDVTDECILCDKLRLSQVLLNCMSNAIKFTSANGTVGMKIIQVPCSKEGYASYKFKIRDTGIGMKKEFIQHIFEPFERERSSTVSGIEGTGLGMAISKNIVDMMGGTINVESEIGVGSEFTINVDFKISPQIVNNFSLPSLKNVHTLVVDGNSETCDSVSKMLRNIGLRPECTMSGKEAARLAQNAMRQGDPFGVYIIDCGLSDSNGIEVIRHIRKECGNDMPVIVLTSYDLSDIEDEARNEGVTTFCSKPLFMSELVSSLQKTSGTFTSDEMQSAENVDSGDGKKLDGLNILLVEDNELNREIAQVILTENGANVLSVCDGTEAVDFVLTVAEGSLDVILMDIQMPIMNGYEATRQIRSMTDSFRSSLPIIAMTANAFADDKKQAFECGMNAHIAKPIDIANVIDTINQVLKRK